MSQVAQSTSPLSHTPSKRAVLLGALVAAVAAVVLAFALAAGSSGQPPLASAQSQPALRADAGPDESVVAASIGSRHAAARPDESRVAASIRPHAPYTSRPDESRVAASIASR